MGRFDKNLQNIVIVFLILGVCYILYRFLALNRNKNIDGSSDLKCNNKNILSNDDYNNSNKWARCPDPASLYNLTEADYSSSDDPKYSLFSRKEGFDGFDSTAQEPVDNTGLWDTCAASFTLTQDTLGYCLKNGPSSSGLFEEMARYACLGNTTNAIVKSILELGMPNGIENNASLANNNASLVFMHDINLIYQKGLDLIKEAKSPAIKESYNAAVPNDKVMAQLILDRWINPANDGPTLILNYVAKNNCHGQVLAASTATSTPAIITTQVSQLLAGAQQTSDNAAAQVSTSQQAAAAAAAAAAQQVAAAQAAAQQATDAAAAQVAAAKAAADAAIKAAADKAAADKAAADKAAADKAAAKAATPAQPPVQPPAQPPVQPPAQPPVQPPVQPIAKAYKTNCDGGWASGMPDNPYNVTDSACISDNYKSSWCSVDSDCDPATSFCLNPGIMGHGGFCALKGRTPQKDHVIKKPSCSDTLGNCGS